jgi:hypothetical protein
VGRLVRMWQLSPQFVYTRSQLGNHSFPYYMWRQNEIYFNMAADEFFPCHERHSN